MFMYVHMYVSIVRIKAARNDNFIVGEGEQEWRLALPRVAANRLAGPQDTSI